MRGSRLTVYIILCLFFSNCQLRKESTFQGIDYSVNKYDTKICCCKYITIENAVFWKLDSLDLNGYRRTLTPILEKECILEGSSWGELMNFFGEPKTIIKNLQVDQKDVIIYVYVIYQFSTRSEDSYKSMFFDVSVDKISGRILNSTIRYTDG